MLKVLHWSRGREEDKGSEEIVAARISRKGEGRREGRRSADGEGETEAGRGVHVSGRAGGKPGVGEEVGPAERKARPEQALRANQEKRREEG